MDNNSINTLDIRGLCWGPPVLAVVGKLKTLKPEDMLMVVSDKESMLNDIPSVCSLINTKLLNTIKLNDLYMFLIQNKKWASA